MMIETIKQAKEWDLLASLPKAQFCATGKLSVVRDDLYTLITLLGGYTSESVTNITQYLIIPDHSWSSSKVTHARERGITIMDEAAFCKMIFPMLVELKF